MGTTVVVAAYVWLRMGAGPQERLVGAMGIVAWYVIVNLVVRRFLHFHFS